MGGNDELPLDDILTNTAWMRRLAQRLVADAAERDDVVQDAWLEALVHAPRAENVRPWLAAVVRNVAFMKLRSGARRRRREERADAAPATATPEELAGRVEVERDVASELLELAEPYRATLLLRYYEDLSSAEIARRLAVPAATVRSRLKRGLDELRARLDARAGGERRRWSLALVPSAVAARGAVTKSIALAIGGAFAMKSAVKFTVAAVLLLALGWGSATLWRHRAPGGEITRARAGVAWHVPGGIGVPGRAPATLAGVSIPDWFGQRGAAVRRIAGRVTVDGTPLAGATVELGSALSDAGVLPKALRQSGADGSFDFGMMPPAVYTLAASAPDHSPAIRPLDTRAPGVASDRVELRLGDCTAMFFGHVNDASGGPIAGAQLCDADPRASACVQSAPDGAYRMCLHPRQTAIEVSAKGYGSVDETFDPINRRIRRDFLLTPEAILVGRVVRADDGSPVVQASVRSVTGELGRQVAAPAASVSDTHGRFTLAGLAPGRHRLVAVASGLGTSDPLEVNVQAGATSPEIVLRLRAAARISGVVTDGHDPVAGASVSVGGAAPIERFDAVTQADGSFVLDSVPRGSVSFRVANVEVLEPKSLVVDRPQLDGVRIVVRTLGSIAGRVTRQGRPVADVPVDVGPFDAGRAFTNNDGDYIIRGLRIGKYRVNAEDRVRGIGGLSPQLSLGAGEQRTGVDVECNYAGAISGTVVEEDGTPAPGVFVEFDGVRVTDHGEAYAGSDGSFRVGTLGGNDDYRANVRQTSDSYHAMTPATGAFPTVFVPNGESEVSGVRIVIKRTHQSIAGTTVDGAGQPLSDVQVVAFRSAEGGMRFNLSEFFGRPHAISGADGRFSIDDLDAGRFVLRGRAGDGSEGTLANVAAGQKGVILPLQPAGGIDGQLVGFATQPDVTVRGDNPFTPAPRSYAQVNGASFSIRGLVPGSYLVDANGGGGDAQVVRVEVGQIATVTLHSRGSGTIHGRVVEWRSGAPVEGFRCVTRMAGGSTWTLPHGEPAFSDADGNFTIEGATEGPNNVLCAWVPSYSEGGANLVVTEGQGSCQITVVKGERPLGLLSYFGGEIGVDPTMTVRIISVERGGPAEHAGIKQGDVLATVDGRSVAGLMPIGDEYAIRDRDPGAHVRIGVLRAGQPISADVVVSGGPNP
jgi:RNA polymerase sigma factor (sigma-70 family)